MKFADPRNDIAFRKIFGDENKKDVRRCQSKNTSSFFPSCNFVVLFIFQCLYSIGFGCFDGFVTDGQHRDDKGQ